MSARASTDAVARGDGAAPPTHPPPLPPPCVLPVVANHVTMHVVRDLSALHDLGRLVRPVCPRRRRRRAGAWPSAARASAGKATRHVNGRGEADAREDPAPPRPCCDILRRDR